MSHFAVMVIGEDVEGQLAPFHEFKCTGLDDQYVQDIDKTEEYLAEYKRKSVKRLRSVLGPQKLYDPYANEFYRDPTPEEKEKIGPIPGSGSGYGMQWTSQNSAIKEGGNGSCGTLH